MNDYDIDALRLSSYPGFFFDSPADVQTDYFSRFDEATTLPLLMVEGGWIELRAHGDPRSGPAGQAGIRRAETDLRPAAGRLTPIVTSGSALSCRP
jgi:hypothetical protein